MGPLLKITYPLLSYPLLKRHAKLCNSIKKCVSQKMSVLKRKYFSFFTYSLLPISKHVTCFRGAAICPFC